MQGEALQFSSFEINIIPSSGRAGGSQGLTAKFVGQLKFLRTVPRQAEVALRRVFLSPRRPTFVGCRGLGVPGSPRIYSQVTWHHNSMHATRCGMDRHNSTRRSPEREKKSENCVGEGKEREIWGPPPFGAPPFGAPPFEAPISKLDEIQFGRNRHWINCFWMKLDESVFG